MASTSLGTIGIKATVDTSQSKAAFNEIVRDIKNVEREAKRAANLQPGGKYAWPYVNPDTMRPTFKTPTVNDTDPGNSPIFPREPKSPGNRKAPGTGNANMIGQNLAFGFDDFLQQTQAQGLSAGLRAVGNNLTAVAAGFGTTALAATAVGVATASLAVKYVELAVGIKEIERQNDSLVKSQDKVNEAFRKSAEIRLSASNIKTQEQAAERLKELQDKLSIVDEQRPRVQMQADAARRDQQERAERQKRELRNAAVPKLSDFAGGPMQVLAAVGGRFFAQMAMGTNVEAAKQAGVEAEKDMQGIAKERREIELEIAEIRRNEGKRLKEAEDANRKAVEKRRDADRGEMIKREMEDFHKQIEEQEREAESLRRQHETSAERRKREIADINRLEEVGALSAQEAQRFREKVNGQDNKLALSGFVSSTSAEAISIINRAAIGVPASDKNEQKQIVSNTNETADNTKQAVALLAKIAQDLGGINAEVA